MNRTFGNIGLNYKPETKEDIKGKIKHWKDNLKGLEQRKKELIKENKFNKSKWFFLETKEEYKHLIKILNKRLEGY